LPQLTRYHGNVFNLQSTGCGRLALPVPRTHGVIAWILYHLVSKDRKRKLNAWCGTLILLRANQWL
jgi:hypothetical protein